MKPVKVLIVEDDPLVALDLEEIVARDPTTEVMVSGSAREAERLCGTEPDFVLLDVDVIDGKTFALARTLKMRDIAFVFVSGSSPGELPPELQDAPFVAKPYDRREIEHLMTTATVSSAAITAS